MVRVIESWGLRAPELSRMRDFGVLGVEASERVGLGDGRSWIRAKGDKGVTSRDSKRKVNDTSARQIQISKLRREPTTGISGF